jgi:hypothetical protein
LVAPKGDNDRRWHTPVSRSRRVRPAQQPYLTTLRTNYCSRRRTLKSARARPSCLRSPSSAELTQSPLVHGPARHRAARPASEQTTTSLRIRDSTPHGSNDCRKPGLQRRDIILYRNFNNIRVRSFILTGAPTQSSTCRTSPFEKRTKTVFSNGFRPTSRVTDGREPLRTAAYPLR